MNNLLRLTAATLALLFLGACQKNEEPPVTAVGAETGNELLGYVPAESPYLLANLEPTPEHVLDVYLNRLQPVLDTMQTELSKARSEMENSTETSSSDRYREPGARLAHALLKELDGKLNRAGLESMGFDLRSHKVLYGMGAFPVFRIGLSDPSALRATIQRLLAEAGIDAPEQDFQGRSFWRVSDVDTASAPVGLYLSVLEDHLAVGMFPPMEEPQLLPQFLGLERPETSDAAERLAKLNRAHGYTPFGTGILDLHLLADRFLKPGTPASRVLTDSNVFNAETLPEECAAEIHEIIDNMPRVTLGTTELSPSAIAVQYRLETPNSLAARLMGLVAPIPGIEAAPQRILEFAFGMRFGPVRDFLREQANAIVNDPYQCEHLADLNSAAVDALASLDQPMPPFVNNFRGIRMSVSEILFNADSIPENARGHLAVHVEQPQMFVGMAQMFLPDLSELSIAPGEDPVRLPESLAPVTGIVAFAAMSDDAIGLSVGEGEEAGLVDFLERKPGPEGVFLAADYDMAEYLDFKTAQSAAYADLAESHAASAPHGQAAEEIQEAAAIAFRNMADRSSTTLKFTPEGFVADSRMTFK